MCYHRIRRMTNTCHFVKVVKSKTKASPVLTTNLSLSVSSLLLPFLEGVPGSVVSGVCVISRSRRR